MYLFILICFGAWQKTNFWVFVLCIMKLRPERRILTWMNIPRWLRSLGLEVWVLSPWPLKLLGSIAKHLLVSGWRAGRALPPFPISNRILSFNSLIASPDPHLHIRSDTCFFIVPNRLFFCQASDVYPPCLYNLNVKF